MEFLQFNIFTIKPIRYKYWVQFVYPGSGKIHNIIQTNQIKDFQSWEYNKDELHEFPDTCQIVTLQRIKQIVVFINTHTSFGCHTYTTIILEIPHCLKQIPLQTFNSLFAGIRYSFSLGYFESQYIYPINQCLETIQQFRNWIQNIIPNIDFNSETFYLKS
jgi:hypothetical protein